MGYEDELSHIYGLTKVDTDTPTSNKDIISYYDDNDDRYYEMYITMTLAIQKK